MSSGATRPWWEQSPARLERELAHLRELGPVVEKERGEAGVVVATTLQHRGEDLSVEVVLRPNHPFVPPELRAEPGVLDRHQNPESGRFCVVDNEEHWWTPAKMAAEMVEQLQRLLDATTAGEVAEYELAMPEPVTGYLSATKDRTILVHDAMLQNQLFSDHGEFELSPSGDGASLISHIDGVDATPVPFPGPQSFSRGARGEWQNVDPPPGPRDLKGLTEGAMRQLAEEAGPLQKHSGRGRLNRSGTVLWTARTFLEEGPRRGEQRRVWVFYRVVLTKHAEIEGVPDLFLTQAYSERVRAERLPELAGLSDCRVAVVGAGALGAPVVGELAKAGCGHIDVIDNDVYDINNAVRHVLPIRHAGHFKASSVAAWAKSMNPFISVEPHEMAVGGSNHAQVKGLVEAAHVVVDSTGLHYVTRLLHREVSDAGNCLVSGGLSLGAYGGRVLVLRSPRPCFDCFLNDPDIPEPLAEPPREEEVTPYGCSHPAASAAGFDATELAAIVSRAVVQATEKTEYPALDYDWAVVNFRPGIDRWRQGRLERLADCPWCRP